MRLAPLLTVTAALLSLVAVAAVAAAPAAIAAPPTARTVTQLSGDLDVHDPALVTDGPGGKWYVFASGRVRGLAPVAVDRTMALHARAVSTAVVPAVFAGRSGAGCLTRSAARDHDCRPADTPLRLLTCEEST